MPCRRARIPRLHVGWRLRTTQAAELRLRVDPVADAARVAEDGAAGAGPDRRIGGETLKAVVGAAR